MTMDMVPRGKVAAQGGSRPRRPLHDSSDGGRDSFSHWPSSFKGEDDGTGHLHTPDGYARVCGSGNDGRRVYGLGAPLVDMGSGTGTDQFLQGRRRWCYNIRESF